MKQCMSNLEKLAIYEELPELVRTPCKYFVLTVCLGTNTKKKWFCYGNKIRDNK